MVHHHPARHTKPIKCQNCDPFQGNKQLSVLVVFFLTATCLPGLHFPFKNKMPRYGREQPAAADSEIAFFFTLRPTQFCFWSARNKAIGGKYYTSYSTDQSRKWLPLMRKMVDVINDLGGN